MPTNRDKEFSGSCACGSVTYQVNGDLGDVIFCHCKQCQKASGHYVASTSAKISDFILTNQESLTWYQSSEQAKRGFCSRCGANLFWKLTSDTPQMNISNNEIGIWPGSLDNPPKLNGKEHIYCSSMAEYYDIQDGLPQYDFFPGYQSEEDVYGVEK